MLRRVGCETRPIRERLRSRARRRSRSRGVARGDPMTALEAELGAGGQLGSALRAGRGETAPALEAELRPVGILVTTRRAEHSAHQSPALGARLVEGVTNGQAFL